MSIATSVSTVTMLTLPNPISKANCAHENTFASASSCLLDSLLQSTIDRMLPLEDMQNTLSSTVTQSFLSSKIFVWMVFVDQSLIKNLPTPILFSERHTKLYQTTVAISDLSLILSSAVSQSLIYSSFPETLYNSVGNNLS